MVEPFRQKEVAPWYHRRFQRVPTIDECHMDDIPCRTEANLQGMSPPGITADSRGCPRSTSGHPLESAVIP